MCCVLWKYCRIPAMGSKLPELCVQLLLLLSSNCSVRSIFKDNGFKKSKCHLQKNPRID